MATLIQSKQIQGVVTASVIEGEFLVSGSLVTSGSIFVDGDITASRVVRGAFIEGDGSRLTGVTAEGTGINIQSGSIELIATQIELSGSGVTLEIINSNTASIIFTGETTFDGNRTISNPDFGDLYTNNFNAGTSGSLTEFIEAVFFPPAAPTATFTNQTSNFNTNLALSGSNMVSVLITDTVDDSPYTLTLTGTDSNIFNAVPTNSASSSWELRLVNDLTASTYTYNVVVGDKFNNTTSYSSRTLTIAQATTGSLSTNGTLYIIESATNGPIYLGANGRSGTSGLVSVSYSPNYGSQVATNFQSSNSLISVNSSTGVLTVGNSISGSGNTNGDIITSTITWNDSYGNSGSKDINVNVVENFAPTLSATSTTNNNTNQASGSSQIIRLTVSDTEGDSIPNDGLTWVNYNSTYFSASVLTPYLYLHVNNTSIPAGVYPYTASFEDIHGFSTTTYSSSVTINQADNGTLGGDINNYIIESAIIGDVLRDATGYNNGNTSRVTVSYSPSYGSPSVQSFTSSNPAVLINSSGYLTLDVNLSGSVTQSGDTFSSTIGWEDQYGNVDSRTINVTVFGNQSPSANFTDNGFESNESVSGSNIGTLTVTDTEGNSPFTITLGGTDGGKFDVSGSSSPFYIQPTGSLSAGNYSIQIVVTDSYSEQSTLNETISVTQSSLLGKVYVYYSTYGSDAGFVANYLSLMGAATINGDTPPEVNSYTANTSSPFYKIKSGEIGNNSISLSTGAMTLAGSSSGSNLNTIIRSISPMAWSNAVQTIIIFPSGSDMTGIPTSMIDSFGGSTAGEYVLVQYINGTSAPIGPTNSIIHSLTLDSPHEGFSEWFVLGAKSQAAGSTMRLQVLPSSGSLGDF
jgi:hypothetical protein